MYIFNVTTKIIFYQIFSSDFYTIQWISKNIHNAQLSKTFEKKNE